MTRISRKVVAALLGGFAAALLCAPAARADQPPEKDITPEILQRVDIEQKLDAQIPLDLKFTDDRGVEVRLAEYFTGQRPVLITLNYYNCPGLCTLVLNGVLDSLRNINWTPGEQFEIVTISFDPLETAALARSKKEIYVSEYGKPEARRHWHFLTGEKENIRLLTQTLGFTFRWDTETQQWAHPSTLIVCTPDGRVSRYLGGVNDDPNVVRLSMVEASAGKVGSLWDRVFLACYHYVPSSGKYVPLALGLMKLGGAAMIFVVAATITILWRAEVRRRRRGALLAGGA